MLASKNDANLGQQRRAPTATGPNETHVTSFLVSLQSRRHGGEITDPCKFPR